jgi:hypothetical protein
MSNKKIGSGAFQSFLLNLIILIILIWTWLSYFLPEIQAIEIKKIELTELQEKYNTLKEKGLPYSDFIELNKSSTKETDIYLINVLKEFKKEDYYNFFINNEWWNYEEFYLKNKKFVKDKLEEQKKSDASKSIERIFPFYAEDSSLTEKIIDNKEWEEIYYLTDFKFINHIEKLFRTFNLKYKNEIGIWDLNNSEKSKEKNENQLEWEIYNFKLNFSLDWKKENIINFLYYLENVWKIHIEKNTSWKEEIKIKEDVDSIFSYNNLIIDIENIKFKDYLDSSNLPTNYDNWETFISFIKKSQSRENYNINIELKFYVKWLPTFKIKKYIKDINNEYIKLKKDINSWIIMANSNKINLKYEWKIAFKKLEEYNKYLLWINKDMESLKNIKELWGDYKKAQAYNNVFKIIWIWSKENIKTIKDAVKK